ncbi:hypothetical protein C8R47DRAFT_1132823 [Mycena vitilis]|nr:hypothetical protein C8R47DRAFT_1132823 [Mycena vitilis]
MTRRYSEDRGDHSSFKKAAGRCGEEEFLVKIYEEVINFLDTLDSGAPMRSQLAQAHHRIRDDGEASKALLTEVLDSATSGKAYAFTDEEPAVAAKSSLLWGLWSFTNNFAPRETAIARHSYSTRRAV